MIPSMLDALRWLHQHNGEGVHSRGRFLEGGEFAPFTPATFKQLRAAGLIEFVGDTKRQRLTDAGRAAVPLRYSSEHPDLRYDDEMDGYR